MGICLSLAIHVLKELDQIGVREICVCPGSRNAPWVAFLAENPGFFKTYSFFEERCAAFFALGRIRATGRPVAVITTSGTAAGELLPATMEAHYSGLPLVLLTADRPRSYRRSGAPQTAEQVGLFGVYVAQTLDLAGEERLSLASYVKNRPLHLNVCFEEPLLQPLTEAEAQEVELWNRRSSIVRTSTHPPSLSAPELDLREAHSLLYTFFKKSHSPLIIVGMLHPQEREAVAQLLLHWKMPAYLEGHSGLREDPRLIPYQVKLPDRILERANRGKYPVDGVIRIGGVPTLRFWRDLEDRHLALPVLSLSRLPFSGLGRDSILVVGALPQICSIATGELERKNGNSISDLFIEEDHHAALGLEALFEEEPLSEPGMIFRLSRLLKRGARVYLGNSLPIREWDLAASRENRQFEVWGSRGLNGIDGQISSFLGFAKPGAENWALIGDLTALYDMPAPWILRQLPEIKMNLVIINNGGGKIFSRIHPHQEFQNLHQLHFKSWAEFWGVEYVKWNNIPTEYVHSPGSRIIEVIPDDESTHRFWEKYAKL